MATSVIMPALEMAQGSGTLVAWLKREGEPVAKGEPIMEIETDKVTIEIEAPASGILSGVLAREGEVVPVGQTIAWILSQGERLPSAKMSRAAGTGRVNSPTREDSPRQPELTKNTAAIGITPLARNMAEEYGIDLALLKPSGRRIEKEDVLAYLREQNQLQATADAQAEISMMAKEPEWKLAPASPKARRLAAERGIDLGSISGSGPDGAVLAMDVDAVAVAGAAAEAVKEAAAPSLQVETPGTVWRVMAERMAESWKTAPHFYLVREVDASRLVEWRSQVSPAVEKRTGIKLTYTDLLVKLLGSALRDHPRLNAAWLDGSLRLNPQINVGIATAIEEGLIVPVIPQADKASLSEIAALRQDLIERAHARKLRPADIAGGTITLTNLGMHMVDAFNAIVNPPQAAILAVGRIADRVIAVNGQAAVRPTMILTLSCDHRVVDGARAAQFLDDLTKLIEEPWRLLV